MKINKEYWVEKGYELFASHGQKDMKVEVLSRQLGISKSSFYHYFADMSVFMDILFDYHISRSRVIGEKFKQFKNIDTDFIHYLMSIKTDLLFVRQLKLVPTNPEFTNCLMQTRGLMGADLFTLWVKEIGLENNLTAAKNFFAVARDNFFLQLSAESINYNWLSDYFGNIKKLIQQLSHAKIA
jgi:AcrR family transcriptional regulator